MECVAHGVSHATLQIRMFRQILASTHRPRPLNRTNPSTRAHFAQASPNTPPASNSSTTDTSPSKLLPQSPVITHPRSGIKKQRKSRPTPEDNAELKKNPWAVALASPVRMCVLTGTRLPRRLMGVYGLVKRPETTQSYLLPLDMIKDSIQKRSVEDDSLMPVSHPDQPANMNVSPLVARDKKLAQRPVLHMVTLGPLMRAVTPYLATKVGKKPGVAKLIPYRWKYPLGPLNSTDLKDCVWRPDMPEFLLRSMREDIVKKIMSVNAEQEGENDIIWETLDIDESCSEVTIQAALSKLKPSNDEACGAVLLFGSKEEHANEQNDPLETIFHPRSLTRIPVFNLSVILSDSHLEMLRQSSSAHLGQTKALFFRPDGSRESTNLMLYLWKLQRFLAETP
ncbi:hypothetical protein VI817_007760 [Penicillium citrinum]|uniref:Required for respiratory growth protein 8, mitochondrial n=1 Tax=Penicillium hetheringtonii TaxID=911720 RepID=A0AAD6DCA0_9EURO|nr:hypothetical protein N7450_010013 [Penicillium hetheringtonii]KAK5790473.1 hypothetical protein VI817_007760 [Penicillium citrinum]